MLPTKIAHAIERSDFLLRSGQRMSRSLHKVVLAGGEPTRKIADLLHGTWLGHPLHPLLTDFAIGGWAFGTLCDAIAAYRGGDAAVEAVADRLIAAGTVAAVPTALAGLADYSAIQRDALSIATLHALLNDLNIALYAFSLRDRRRGNRKRAVAFSAVAFGLMGASAWLGGHLIYRQEVGTNRAQSFEGPDDWTPVLDADALGDGEAKRVEVDGKAVLVARQDGAVYAIGAVCSHASGPLDEGDVDGCYVTCPWHHSVFDLRDGRVKHGPATNPQPNFNARIRDGRVEIRLERNRS